MQHHHPKAPPEGLKSNSDIFLARLQLMVVMSKAYLEGLPIGDHRKQAIIENANTLFYQSLFAEYPEGDCSENLEEGNRNTSHTLYEKVRLLTVMAKAFAEGRLTGDQKKKDLKANLDYICEAITFNGKMNNIDFLHVA